MAWSLIGNLKGPSGDQGVEGPPGATTWDGITDKPIDFWTGTMAEYNAIPTKDPSTFYICLPS